MKPKYLNFKKQNNKQAKKKTQNLKPKPPLRVIKHWYKLPRETVTLTIWIWGLYMENLRP